MQMHHERGGLMTDLLSLEQRWIQPPELSLYTAGPRRKRPWLARLGIASFLMAVTTAAGGGGGGSDSLHSLDRTSASAVGGVEVYEDSTGAAVNPVITKGQLQLPNVAAIDALATGRETGVGAILAGNGHYPGMGGPHVRYQFSVDRLAVDDFEGTVVDSFGTPLNIQENFHEEFENNDQAADILDNVGLVQAGIVYRINFLQADEELLELAGGNADDIDGFTSVGAMGGSPDSNDDGVLDRAVYFSVDGQSGGMHPANIYVKRPGEGIKVYANFLELGLDLIDDIDALSVWDATMNGVFDAGDGVVFSLRKGSASLPITVGATSVTAGGVIFATPAGGFEDALPAGFFSLQNSDELDAVHVVDPREVQLPCEDPELRAQPIRAAEALVATPSTLEVQYEGACTGERNIGVSLNQTFRDAAQSGVIKEFHVLATSSDASVAAFTGASPMGWSGPGPNDSYGCGAGAACMLDRAQFGAMNLDANADGSELLQGLNRCLGNLTVELRGVGTAEIEISCIALGADGAQIEVLSDVVRVVVKEASGEIFGNCGQGANAPCGNTSDACTGCRNSTGLGAQLIGVNQGSLSASTAEGEAGGFCFRVKNLPFGVPILLFSGQNQLNGGQGVPFGDGLRCVGGSVTRHGIRFGGPEGTAEWSRIQREGVFGAGETRAFQGWYRDNDGPCGSKFNLTNGYAVTGE